MTLLGCNIEQARARFGWRGLADFLKHIPSDSATFAEQDPEHSTRHYKTQALELLASIFDALAWVNNTLYRLGGAKPQDPAPYQLPWRQDKRRKIGAGAIPVKDFFSWYYGGD